MDLTSLSSFLLSSKRNVDTAINKTLGDIHVVLCNEAADLDSVVSSIVTGFYIAHSICKEEKENKSADQQSFVFSVINCTREDFPLRTEVLYFLKENGVRPYHLICRDEIDLNAIHVGGKLKLTLVDHNVLAGADAHLAPSLHRVIDHHKREKPLDRRDVIESVGSCSTLVAEMVLGLFDHDPVVCRLLHGAIVLDTYNLSAAAQRTTAKDVKSLQELEDAVSGTGGRGGLSRDDIFKALIQARADVSKLTAEQLLRKDAKILRTPEMGIVLPAVPLLSQKLLEMPNMMEALRASLRTNHCVALVILCYRVSEISGEIKKDIVVYSDSIHKAKQVCTPLENSELELRRIRSSSESQSALFAYQQGNITLSRKFVLPFLAAHFEGKGSQTALEVDALHGVDLLMPNGEPSPSKFLTSPLPSISYTAVSSLGVGDPISQSGSSQNSAYNSCPYTPQNSCSEPVEGCGREHYFLPSFNSREMIEKIELKRGKLRGYEKTEDDLRPNPSSYPFTPKNSYVESSLDALFEQQSHAQVRSLERQQSGGVLHAIDSDLLLRKLMEKRRGEPTSSSYFSSSGSSKSQSLTKLNTDDFLTPGGDCPQSPNPLGSPNQCQTPPRSGVSRPTDIPHPHSYPSNPN